MSNEQLESFTDSHIAQLSEHFDSVQISATTFNPDGSTTVINRGSGNFFTRYGSTKMFVSSLENVELASSLDKNT